MPAIRDLLAKMKSFPSAAVNFFRKAAERLARADIPGKLRGLIRKPAQFIQQKIPGAKERLIFACLAGAVCVLIFGALIIVANSSGGGGQSFSAADSKPETDNSARAVIPQTDIFLPDEPDFVPGIMLERERRTHWTTEDAAPLWNDPLRNGEEQWRERLEKEIDKLMERVP